MISIIDTGGANLASVVNALTRLEYQVTVTARPSEIEKASHVILPGVGAALDSMNRLKNNNLVSFIRQLKQPTLGICLGMQLLFEASREGETDCLGIFPGIVERIPYQKTFPVPHMGWNQIEGASRSLLLRDIPEDNHFYFVHSFVAPNGKWVKGSFRYGAELFPAVVEEENFFGVQFHPEKSSRAGALVLKNFLSL
jgi:imidazole glycerol-phosphate synthase subunit HisH